MGVKNLLSLLAPVVKEALTGKNVGVDFYGWFHEAIIVNAVNYVLLKSTNEIMNFLRYRVLSLCKIANKVILVFDGNSAPGKQNEENKRHGQSRSELERELQDLADQKQNGPTDKDTLEKLCKKLCGTIPKDLFKAV